MIGNPHLAPGRRVDTHESPNFLYLEIMLKKNWKRNGVFFFDSIEETEQLIRYHPKFTFYLLTSHFSREILNHYNNFGHQIRYQKIET